MPRTTRRLTGLTLSLVVASVLARALSGDAPYTVAYASFGPVNSAIFIADADGSHERVLISPSVQDSNPSMSPDGQWVVFTSRRDGSADIYRVRPDGSGLERLTDDPAFDDQAAVSPDGNRLAFVSSRTGQADIWLLDLRTGRLRNLTNHPGGDYRPAWSPDGAWIAFTSDRASEGARAATPRSSGRPFSPDQLTQIYAVRENGSDLRQVTTAAAAAGSAAWSPDSRQITFYEAAPEDWRIMGRSFTAPAAASQIIAVDVASGARRALTSGPGRKYAPKWITSGRVAYVRGSIEEKPGALERVNYQSEGIAFTDGSTPVKGVFSNVNWSPDGQRIVFHRELDETWPPASATFSRDPRFNVIRTGIFPSYSPDGQRMVVNTGRAGNFHNAILVMNADGTNRRVVFDDPNENAVAPTWSPRGDLIAFGLGRYNNGRRGVRPGGVAVVGVDGSGLRMLTPVGEVNHGFPSWSPDGKRLVLRSEQPNSKGLVILDTESGSLMALTSGPWIDNFPAWSPQGDRIVFTSDRDGDWELYTIRPDGRELKRVTRSPGNDAHPAWSSDGQWIAFASARGGFKDEMPVGEGGGQGAGDIFVMRFDGTDVHRLTDDAFEEATPAFAPRPR
jgi:TolB protein